LVRGQYSLYLPRALRERAEKYMRETGAFSSLADLVRFALDRYIREQGYQAGGAVGGGRDIRIGRDGEIGCPGGP